MKQHQLFPRKTRWQAWRRAHSQQQAGEPDRGETPLPADHLHGGLSQSEALGQWLKAGGKPGEASLYDVEIFIGMA